MTVEPEVIDFGRARDLGVPLELSFAVANSSERAIGVTSVTTGCGCTTPGLTDFVIPPGDRVTVPVRLNLRGRSGRFSNQIVLTVAGHKNPIQVPINGTVVTDIWHDGQAIRCNTSPSSTRAEGAFQIYTLDWPSIAFDVGTPIEGFIVEETSRTLTAGLTVINFRLVALDVPLDQYCTTRSLTLKPLDDRVQPISIPVSCYRPAVEGSAAMHGLTPNRIAIGTVRPGESRVFHVYGDGDLVDSLTSLAISEAPEGFQAELLPQRDKNEHSRSVALKIGETVQHGLFEARIRLEAKDGRMFSIEVLGMVRHASLGS